MENRRIAILQRVRPSRRAQRGAGEHGVALGGADAVGQTPKNFQERGAEAGFRLCEGHCGVHDCGDEIRKIWRVECGFGTAQKF